MNVTNRVQEDVTFTAVRKQNGETYIFAWTDSQRIAMLRKLGEYASNPQLSFNWIDAAKLTRKVIGWD